MWITSIRLRVATADAPNAGTDNTVRATIVRDGIPLVNLRLDYTGEDDLERGAVRDYTYLALPWYNDRTRKLPGDVSSTNPPYPSNGIEFSDGLYGHLKLRLSISGFDTWIKDSIHLYVKESYRESLGDNRSVWREMASWWHVASFGRDIAMSLDPTEGFAMADLVIG